MIYDIRYYVASKCGFEVVSLLYCILHEISIERITQSSVTQL